MKPAEIRELTLDDLRARVQELGDQIFPPRLMKRVIATRAASICRSVSQHGSMALSP